jgi:hypothetical protein
LQGKTAGGEFMRYLIAWLLGVPGGIIILWFLFNNASCG